MIKKNWTKEEIIIIALQYKTRNEFKKEHNKAYCAAKRRGILNIVCEHMLCGKTKWTKEKILNISKKYNTISEFKKYNLIAYKRASANGWLNEISSHMKFKYKNKEKNNLLFI
jgi:hypothetical protein